MLAGWPEKLCRPSKTSEQDVCAFIHSGDNFIDKNPENQPELAMTQAPDSMTGRHLVGLTTYIRCLP